MLGAVDPLRRRGFEVDVRGCRQMSEGIGVLRARARSLPRFVVIGLGTNWTVTLDQIRQALRIVGRQRVLGLVTREVGGVRSSDQRAARGGEALAKPGARCRLGRSERGPQRLVLRRRLHLTPKGARALARLIRAALTTPPAAPSLPPRAPARRPGFRAPPRSAQDPLAPSVWMIALAATEAPVVFRWTPSPWRTRCSRPPIGIESR